MLRLDRGGDLLGRRVVDVVVADLEHRGGVAAAHAGRADDADMLRVVSGLQRGHQLLRARELAGERITDPDRQRRRRRLALAHHVEMGVEGGDLVDLGLAETQLLGQRRKMRRREMPVRVLDQVKELDQMIAPARPVAEKAAHLGQRRILELAPLRRVTALAATALPGAGFRVERAHGLLPDSFPRVWYTRSRRGEESLLEGAVNRALPRPPVLMRRDSGIRDTSRACSPPAGGPNHGA